MNEPSLTFCIVWFIVTAPICLIGMGLTLEYFARQGRKP